MRVYLAFESVCPCLRGSSSNSAHLLSSFFLGMMSLKDLHSLLHLGAERLGGLQHVQQLRAVDLQQHPSYLPSQVRVHRLDEWEQALTQHLLLFLGGEGVAVARMEAVSGSCP